VQRTLRMQLYTDPIQLTTNLRTVQDIRKESVHLQTITHPDPPYVPGPTANRHSVCFKSSLQISTCRGGSV